MAKNNPLLLSGLITTADMTAWYQENPVLPTKAIAAFPLIENMKGTSWHTISNATTRKNVAADPISLNSSVPVSNRPGFKKLTGDMASFGKGRIKDADDLERFEELKRRYQEWKNPANAAALVAFYGEDLTFVRDSMIAEMSYLCWAMISSACDHEFVAANSPYMASLANVTYPVLAWQKNAVGTAWSDPASDILDDIDNVLIAGKARGLYYNTIHVNEATMNDIRKNEQVQKYCATLVSNQFNTQAPPTTEVLNAMLRNYFNRPVNFVVVDELVTRENLDGTETTANPFADDVAVFSITETIGHFEWNGIPIANPTLETRENFFVVGSYTQVDPNLAKTYAKGRGMAVVDTYDQNFYLKTNAVAW